MTTHTLNGREILAVKVHNRATEICTRHLPLGTILTTGPKSLIFWRLILPFNCSIIGRKQDVTEEVAKRLGFGSAREADFWFWVNGITDEVLLIKNK